MLFHQKPKIKHLYQLPSLTHMQMFIKFNYDTLFSSQATMLRCRGPLSACLACLGPISLSMASRAVPPAQRVPILTLVEPHSAPSALWGHSGNKLGEQAVILVRL